MTALAQSNTSAKTALQIGATAVILVVWEVMSRSGLFYQDVIPSIVEIIRSIVNILAGSEFYRNLGVTAYELLVALVIGVSAGTVVGMCLGTSRFLSQAYERYFYYLGTTPKIVFFPLLITWFGIGAGSKIAMGSLAFFLPVVLSVSAGVRGIDPTLIKVGRSFNAGMLDMARKVYLPAIKPSLFNGFRLGAAYAVVSVLLAETKMSNSGIGFMISDAFMRFQMPRMYAILIIIFLFVAILDSIFVRFLRSRDPALANF